MRERFKSLLIRDEKGSIAVITTASMLLFLAVAMISYTFITQKNTVQSKEVKRIEEEYQKNLEETNIEEIYEETLQKNI